MKYTTLSTDNIIDLVACEPNFRECMEEAMALCHMHSPKQLTLHYYGYAIDIDDDTDIDAKHAEWREYMKEKMGKEACGDCTHAAPLCTDVACNVSKPQKK